MVGLLAALLEISRIGFVTPSPRWGEGWGEGENGR
jgi:hypothetical protein